MLTAEHRAYLEAHAVDPKVAGALGVRSITSQRALPKPFRWLNSQGHPALLYPYTFGGRERFQLHPDVTPTVDGEALKYIFPKGEQPLLWRVHDPSEPKGVAIVEGTKQALAVASTGIQWTVYAIAGKDAWYVDGAPLPSMFGLAVDRELVCVLDADVASNPSVWDTGERMLAELRPVTGARSVKVARAVGAGRHGLDDVLARTPRAQRAGFVLRTLDSGVTKMSKLCARPKKPTVPTAVAMFFDGDGRFLPMTTARHIDDAAPFAVHRASGAMYRYDSKTGVYRRRPRTNEDRTGVGDIVAALLGDEYHTPYAAQVADALRAHVVRCGRVLDDAPDSRLVAVANGVLDPYTGRLVPHSPDNLILGAWSVPYDPDATCPRIMAYLERHFPDQVDTALDTACRMLGRDIPQDRVLFVFGPPRSGKSTLLMLLARLVGEDGRAGVPLHKLLTNNFATARLYGKTLNVGADISAEDVRNTDVFKSLTGGDLIDGEFKYHDGFQFVNRAMLAFSMNTIPGLPVDSSGEMDRIVPVCAPRSFSGREDPKVLEDLSEELPGLLAELARRFQRRANPEPVPAVLQEFKLQSDRVHRFVEARCEPLAVDEPLSAGAKASDVYTAFKEWSERDNAGTRLSDRKFYASMAERGYPANKSMGYARFRLRLRTGADSAVEEPLQKWLRGLGLGDLGNQPSYYGRAREKQEDTHAIEGGPVSPRSPLSPLEGEENPVEQMGLDFPPPAADRMPDPGSVVAVDFETPDADQMAAGKHEGEFCRLLAFSDGIVTGTTADQDQMRRVLTDAERLVTHNGWAFDLPAAAMHLGLDVDELVAKSDDMLIAAKLAEPPRATSGAERDRYDLGSLAPRVGGEKGDRLPVLKRRYKGYDKIPVDDAEYNAYARTDADITLRLVTAIPVRDEAYWARERRVAALAASLTVRGLRIDTELTAQVVAGREEIAWRRLPHLAELGMPEADTPRARPWTSDQGREVLAKAAAEAGLEQWPTTEKGAPRTDREVLTEMLDVGGMAADIAESILAITAGGSRFVADVGAYLSQAAGRVHPQHKIASATGRWSTSNPNILGAGKRTKALSAERDVILAEPGEVFVAIDLAGIDQRAVWGLSGDEAYGELFATGVDIHTEMAELYFGDRSKASRTAGKSISHGIPCGRGPKGIANMLIKTPGRYFDKPFDEVLVEVRQAWDRYYARYAGVKAWQDRVRSAAEAGEELDNGFGRKVRTIASDAYTEAPARLGQSAARDLAMQGLLAVKDAGLWPMARAFVHDELVLSVPEDQADGIGHRVAELMSFDWESPSGVTVPIVAQFDGKVGPRWSDCY